MNPTDFFLLFVSLAFAAVSISVRGWTLYGIGPALFATTAGFWQFWVQWLRHRSWLRHRDAGFASPSTEPPALSAGIGWILGMGWALLWAFLVWTRTRP